VAAEFVHHAAAAAPAAVSVHRVIMFLPANRGKVLIRYVYLNSGIVVQSSGPLPPQGGRFDMFHQPDLHRVQLNPRAITAAEGNPVVNGKILYVSEDRKITHGVWESTPGVFDMTFQQDDSGCVLSGNADAVLEDGTVVALNAGTLYTFRAGANVRLIVRSTWRKLFFNYYPQGTDLQAGY
jgi:uncharacterized cupin superfamily protein